MGKTYHLPDRKGRYSSFLKEENSCYNYVWGAQNSPPSGRRGGTRKGDGVVGLSISKFLNFFIFKFTLALSLSIFNFQFSIAQNINPRPGERIFVKGGVAEVAAQNRRGVNLAEMTPDSLFRFMAALDSLRADGIRFNRAETDSIVTALIDRTAPEGDTLDQQELADLIARRKKLTLNSATVRRFMDDPAFIGRYIDGGADTLIPKFAMNDTLSRREKRRLARLDPNAYRHSFVFRDSIKLSPVVALSIPLPGFSQLYNKQAWKIPILYGSVAAGVGVYSWQTREYKPLKREYDRLIALRSGMTESGAAWESYKAEVTGVQSRMIQHNTYRQLALGFAAASYMYFLVDGTLNYPGTATNVKKATTLAMVFPGAGQVYNKTYWKLPIVVGGTAILGYVVNWNNRGYQRFKTAYTQRMDGIDETVDEFDGQYGDSFLINQRDAYRRSRDLCMIFLGLFYIVQVIDAHATAHMTTYDVSDDLTRFEFTPSMDRLYSYQAGSVNTFGFSFSMRF
jgi:hypothetical protein